MKEAHIKFPQELHAGIDFGAQHVVDECVKQLVLKTHLWMLVCPRRQRELP